MDECEPDSQLDDVEFGEEFDLSTEDSLSRRNSTQTSLLELTQDTVSINSQNSFDSQQSKLKIIKYPILNTIFQRVANQNTLCRRCDSTLKTKELSRLLTHLKKCRGLNSLERADIMSKVQSEEKSSPIKSRNAELNEAWGMFLVENNVALRAVETGSFRFFAQLINPAWRYADRHKYSNEILPAISKVIERRFQETTGDSESQLTVEFDHWSDKLGRSFLGIVCSTLNGSRFLLDLIDVSLEGHSAAKTVPHLIETMDKLPDRAINSIISDSASACKLSRELIVETANYKRLIQHRCLAHLVNRMGNLFGENEHIKEAVAWASKTSGFIANHTKLSAAIRDRGSTQPTRLCNVRWYSTVNMVESLLKAKSVIFGIIGELPNQALVEWIRDETMWSSIKRSLKIIRPMANCIAITERKTGSLGEAVTGLLHFTKSLFSEDWGEPLIVAAIASVLNYLGPKKLGEDEFGLLLASYILDRRNKCDYVTEKGQDIAIKSIINIAARAGLSESNIKAMALVEYPEFCAQKGEYSRNQPGYMSAATWWYNINPCSCLRQVALRIARLQSSSANIERTFSDLKWFQGDRRANLSIETLKYLCRIKIFDDYANCRSTESSPLNHYVVESQQLSQDSSSQNCDLEADCVETVEGEACYLPELLSEEERIIWNDFNQYIDFSKVNELIIDDAQTQQELSGEQVTQLLDEYRETRDKGRLSSGSAEKDASNALPN